MLLVKTDKDKEALVKQLLTLPVMELADRLAEYMMDYGDLRPIVVSQEEYDRITGLFKIRGLKADGTPETRGRKG